MESWLAINPRDPRNLVAASITGNGAGVAAYSSFDGGKVWIRATHGPGRETLFDGIDPAAAFHPDGNAYLLSAGKELAVWKSTDGGRTWDGRAVVPGRAWDRPFIRVGAPGGGSVIRPVYVSGKMPITVFGQVASDVIGFSTSTDRGATFSFPRLILTDPVRELLNVPSDLAVTSEDAVIVALQLFPPQDLRTPLLSGRYSTIISTDGGRSFSEPRPVSDFHCYGHGREGKSLFGLGGGRLAVDSSSGSSRGRLCFVWLDVVEGFYQVMASASADNGRTWSTPARVNDNGTQVDQSNPAIAVDGNGVIGVAWNDRRGDPTARCFQTFFTISADGGKTFLPNRRVSDAKTCPTPAGVDPVESDYRFKNGGDTQGLVGLPAGGFHLAWINGAGRELQLWSTSISVGKPTGEPASSTTRIR
ncbi:MAG: hypothetical protein ABI968_08225 [Acidobacteriota bacterium]